jgi:hypothetical protein
MKQTDPGEWRKEFEVKECEINPELYREFVKVNIKSCWNCFNTLMLKPKDALARMVLEFLAPKPKYKLNKDEVEKGKQLTRDRLEKRRNRKSESVGNLL